MNLRDTASRALQFVAEGHDLSQQSIAKLNHGDFAASIELQHELERALITIETGRKTLHAVLMILAANHEASKLPSECAK